MRVLIISNKVPYPANDGSSLAMRSTIDALRSQGVELSLISLNTRKHFRDLDKVKALAPEDLDWQAIAVNTDISTLGALLNLISGKAYHVSRFYQSAVSEAIKEKLTHRAFDLIQLEGLSMAVYLPLLRKLSNAPVVMRAHNIEYLIWQRHLENESNPWQARYLKIQVGRLKKFEEWAWKNVDANIFITKQDLQFYRQQKGKSIATALPCGLNGSEYQQSPAESCRFDLVHLASLDWLPNQQGLEWFLNKVWPMIKAARPQTQVVIGGRDMPKSLYEKSEDGLNFYPKVEDAQAFIRSGKLAIIPLLAGSGMRIKLVEYLAMGQAAVSTEIGAEGIDIENGREAMLAKDAESFASAVVYLLENDAARQAMEKAALQYFKEHFSNEQVGKELLKFYQTLL